jgi:hypothetical protein
LVKWAAKWPGPSPTARSHSFRHDCLRLSWRFFRKLTRHALISKISYIFNVSANQTVRNNTRQSEVSHFGYHMTDASLVVNCGWWKISAALWAQALYCSASLICISRESRKNASRNHAARKRIGANIQNGCWV